MTEDTVNAAWRPTPKQMAKYLAREVEMAKRNIRFFPPNVTPVTLHSNAVMAKALEEMKQ